MMNNKKESLSIVVDFDGTCVTHEFPHVGKDIGAVPVLKRLVNEGHRLILFTMRSNRLIGGDTGDLTILDYTGNFLDDAVNWFKNNDIELFGIQSNPTQHEWTTSPKAYGQMYIDDAALGCPLVFPGFGLRPYVDWEKVEEMLINNGTITTTPEEVNQRLNNA